MFGRRKRTTTPPYDEAFATKSELHRATRPRMTWSLLTSLFLLITVVFLILVEVGDTAVGSIRSKIYFINLNLTNIVPVSIPDATLINSIAQTLGLHDFYTVGLWGYCEGYNGVGTTTCSKPQTLYWFNPVSIISNQLIAGASIALPLEINNILKLIRIVSHWMFGLFLSGACLSFVMIFIVPLSVYSRWASLPITIFTFLAALLTTVGSVIATVLFIIMRDVITAQTTLNIKATIGIQMFAYMWIAAGASIIAFVIQLGMCCCCASRRDVRTGRKRGSMRAWRKRNSAMREKPTEETMTPPLNGEA